MDPRTPVVVGVGTAGGRPPAGTSNEEPLELMAAACRSAALDAGTPAVLARAGLVIVPRGTWPYRNAAGLVAERIGCGEATGVVADIGILQTTLVARAASAIADGQVDVAIVVGAEARWRDIQAKKAGTRAAITDDSGAVPDEVMSPEHEIITGPEMKAGLIDAPSQYSLLENATRYAAGQSLSEHRNVIARLWAGFNQVARTYPEAWNPQPFSADDLQGDGAGRLLAFPYRKWHVSQWNVDQAGSIVLCSAEVARQLGIPTDRWVFPHAITWSDHMVPVSQRAELHRSPGFAEAGREAFRLARASIDDVGHIDLYSCFPIAVRHQARELGLGLDRQLTLTGGMTFGGGPLNNYALQSLPAMVRTLRADPGSLGLVTSVSGMVTKQGVSLWSSEPPPDGYCRAEVGGTVAPLAQPLPMVQPDGQEATVATYTSLAGRDGVVARAVVVADVVGGGRAVAVNDDPALAAAMTEEEWCGRRVVVSGGGWIPAG